MKAFCQKEVFMERTINIANREKAIENLKDYKEKKYVLADVRFLNVHLREINKLLEFDIFSKNDLFINTISLWELMQPLGEKGGHNYHDLSPEDIADALSSITEPYCILKTEISQYAILSTMLSHFGEPLMIIIEVGSGNVADKEANINKLITMFPKRDIDKSLEHKDPKDILYRSPKQNPSDNS